MLNQQSNNNESSINEVNGGGEEDMVAEEAGEDLTDLDVEESGGRPAEEEDPADGSSYGLPLDFVGGSRRARCVVRWWRESKTRSGLGRRPAAEAAAKTPAP